MDKKTGGAAINDIPEHTDIPKPKFSGYQVDTRAIKVKDMSLQIMAAIELRIPESGIDWLDEMIAKAERRDIAVEAFKAICSFIDSGGMELHNIRNNAWEQADAMIAERAKEK